jgi:hypothetical protein
MADADHDARAIVAAFVASRGPDPARRRANWNATLARLEEDPLAEARMPRRSRAWPIAIAAAVVAAIATAAFGGGILVAREPAPVRSQAADGDAERVAPEVATVREPAIAPQSVPAPAPRIAPAALPAPPVETPPAPAPARRARVPAPVEPASEAPAIVVTPERLKLETDLVARARAAAGAGDDAKAIALLRQHAREFADGAMVEDRRAWLAIVLCRSKGAGAAAAARSFLAAHPRSPYVARVRSACGEIE